MRRRDFAAVNGKHTPAACVIDRALISKLGVEIERPTMKDVTECKDHYTFNAMKGTLLNEVARVDCAMKLYMRLYRTVVRRVTHGDSRSVTFFPRTPTARISEAALRRAGREFAR